MSLKKTAIQGSKWTAFGTIGIALMQILQVVVLTRFLSKESFGLFTISLFVIHFFLILSDFGFNSALMHKQTVTKNQFSSLYILNLLVAIVLYLVLLGITPVVSSFYDNQQLNLIISVHGVLLFFNAIGKYHRLMLHKKFNFKQISIIEICSYFVGLLAAIFLAYQGYQVYSLVVPALLTALISNLAFFIGNTAFYPLAFRFKFLETKPFLRIGGYHMGSAILDYFSKEIDVMIIGKVLGSEMLGVYSLIKQIVVKVFKMINPIIINVIVPIFSSIQADILRVKKIYKDLIRFIALFNLPLYAILIFCSTELLALLYGQVYANYSLVLSFIAFTYFIISIFNSVGSLQIATGRTDLGFRWTILRFIATPMVIYFAAQFSLLYVAAAYSMLFIAFVIPIWKIQLQPMINIGLTELLAQFFKPFVVIVLVLLLKLYTSDWIFTDYLAINLLFKSSFILIVVSLFALLFQKQLLSEMIHKTKALLQGKFKSEM